MLSRVCISTLGAALLLAPAWASSSHTSPSQMRFITQAAQGEMAEVELGTLASQKASNADVQQFAQRMIQDHTKAKDNLKTLANKMGLTLPPAPTAREQALKQKLSALSGDRFDKAYMQAMVKDHRHDVTAFEREANEAGNSDLKTFASNTLPALEDHLKMAEHVDSEVARK